MSKLDSETIENIDDVEETKLDDDIDTLTNKITDLETQRATLTVPEELSLNTGVNSDLLTQMAEKLKTMPRNKILQMINSLAKANKLPDHDFSTFNKSSIKSNTEKINKKIKELKAKRYKKGFRCDYTNNRNKTTTQPEIHSEEKLTNISENKQENHSEVENLNISEENKILTRNQKRKLRKKKSQLKTDELKIDELKNSEISVNSDSNIDSNLVSSVGEIC